MLAYLACYADWLHPREILIELHWPESDPKSGRACPSRALTPLCRQFEPRTFPRARVIAASAASVQTGPTARVTGVAQFEAALQAARRAGSSIEKGAWLTEAVGGTGASCCPDS